MVHYCVHRRARSEQMKQLESTMIRLQADLGPQHRGADSLAAPIIVLAMERQRQCFRDAIRGTAMLYLDHLVWAIESWDGMCEIERGITRQTPYAPHTHLLPLVIRRLRTPHRREAGVKRLDGAYARDAVHVAPLP